MCSCSILFFSQPLILTLVAANIFHFLTAAIKLFLRFPSNEIDLLCFLSLTLALSLKVRVAMRFISETRG